MRATSSAIVVSLLLVLAGCAASSNSTKGGFMSDLKGLFMGGHDGSAAERSSDLNRRHAQQVAAKAQADRANAARAQRQQSIEAMRASISDLDHSLQTIKLDMIHKRAGDGAVSARDAQYAQLLENAEAWLADLRSQLTGDARSVNYGAARREYQNLQEAVQALRDQLEEERS
jgi:hypothetical protein